jgi:two-component system, NtrC family, response regulator
MKKILTIGADGAFLDKVESHLSGRYGILKTTSGKGAKELFQSQDISAVLLELTVPDLPSLDFLKWILERTDPPVVLVAANQLDEENAIEAVRLGAYTIFPKNASQELLDIKLKRGLEWRALAASERTSRHVQADQYNQLIFASEAMKKIHLEITRLASVPFDVLLKGETGVGKDLLAFELHRRGPRRDRPFIPVPMAPLSETLIESELFGHVRGAFSGADMSKIGRLEAANGGTVYIPEVSNISENLQLKLLHFLQYKSISKVGQDPRRPEARVDVRIIMASNENLEKQVESGVLRRDFYHRISGVQVMIPPLRERGADVQPIAEYCLQKFSASSGMRAFRFDPEVMDAFREYPWPGNVRELENVIMNAIAHSSGETLTRDDFPHLSSLSGGADQCRFCMASNFSLMPSYRQAEQKFKLAYVDEALRRGHGKAAQAAKLIGVTPQGFRKILNKLRPG